MTAKWRYLIFDIRTLSPQAELTVVDNPEPSFKESLNEPGNASFTIPIAPDEATVWSGIVYNKNLFLQPNAVFAVEKDDVLVWAGPIIGYSMQNDSVQYNCEGIFNYLRRRKLYLNQTFTSTEQTTIAKTLIDYAQNFGNGYYGINTTKVTATGVLRDRTYKAIEKRWIGEMIEQLAASQNGFDFRLAPRWTNGPNSQLTWDFLTMYPKSGRVVDLTFDAGGNCNLESYTSDGTNLAYSVVVLGAQFGGTAGPLSVQVGNASLILANILLEGEETYPDVSLTNTLNDYGAKRLARGSKPKDNPGISVDSSYLGELVIGDSIRFNCDLGLVSVDSRFKIVSMETRPNQERTYLELIPVELFSA